MNPLFHNECLELVCAVCTNLNGVKPSRQCQKLMLRSSSSMSLLATKKAASGSFKGLCVKCSSDLHILDKQVLEELGAGGGDDECVGGEVSAGPALVEAVVGVGTLNEMTAGKAGDSYGECFGTLTIETGVGESDL